MRQQILTIGLMLAGVIGISPISFGLPVPNQQGDYPIPSPRQRGNRQVNWLVVDPDPQGLRCRMAKQFQGVSVDGLDAPAALFRRNRYNVSQWSIVTTFRRGQRIQAITGNMANQIVIVDNRGKPWLPIATTKGNCFVRANSRFIQPIREDSIKLTPLE